MKFVLVTGAYGFIGKNLCTVLEKEPSVQVLKYGSNNTIKDLISLVNKSDQIVHLAGINRPEKNEDFYTVNKDFTQTLLDTIYRTNRKIPIIYASSTQAELNNDYGKSKKAAEDLLIEAHKIKDIPLKIFRLPNVFGKWSLPNYNSVIATWCHCISHDKEISINNESVEISLVYIDDVVSEIINELKGFSVDIFGNVKTTYIKTLGEISKLLFAFKDNRTTLVMPDLNDDFSRKLYSTYLSYLPIEGFNYELKMNHDNRGWLTEFIKSNHFGQIFISKTKPGITRGNHWHHTKVEKFLVIQGEGMIKFRHIENEDVLEYLVNGEFLTVLDIPPGYTHSIKNIGKTDMFTLFWANEIFNTENPDTACAEV